jgi:cell wall-associated NlpC family hydrolase
MTNILEDYAKTIDSRTSLFDVQIDSETDETITLSGRVLDKAQLDELPRLFPDRKLDTASIRILNTETHAQVHVTTNLTGLYERPTFGMPLSSELYFGTDLEILEEDGNWVFIRQPDRYLGWAYRRYLGEGTAPTATHLVLAPAIELREGPDQASGVVTRLVSGTGVGVVEKRGDWSLVRANREGWIPSSSLRVLRDIPEEIEEKRELMVTDAMRMIGVPYLWGGTSGNGIDCSGFARLLHRWVGMDIPRDADMQHDAAKPVEPPYEIGDLFFFGEGDSERNITHVGMSLGGWRMIHSSRGNNGVYVDDLQERKPLMDIFVSAGSFLR